jgi:hypothetical protein
MQRSVLGLWQSGEENRLLYAGRRPPFDDDFVVCHATDKAWWLVAPIQKGLTTMLSIKQASIGTSFAMGLLAAMSLGPDLASAQSPGADCDAQCVQRMVDVAIEKNDQLVKRVADLEAVVAKNKEEAESKPVINYITGSRAIGTVYQNQANRTKIVIVTGMELSPHFTMYANVASSSSLVPSGKTGGSSASTVAAASYYGDIKHFSSFTFVVPVGSWYSVTTDGGNIQLVFWTEVDL